MLKKIKLEIGWYSGEFGKVFGLNVCERGEGIFSIVHVQVAKFLINAYLEK